MDIIATLTLERLLERSAICGGAGGAGQALSMGVVRLLQRKPIPFAPAVAKSLATAQSKRPVL